MSSFLVAVFQDEAKAQEGARVLKNLHFEGSIKLHGLAVVAKDAEGKLSAKESAYEGPHGTAVGALIGGLAGLPGGPVAATVGAATGALIGLSADLVNRDVDTEFVDEVARKLLRDKAAVVAEVSEDQMSAFDTQMAAIGGTIIRE